METCLFCDQLARWEPIIEVADTTEVTRDEFQVKCKNCGDYFITNDMEDFDFDKEGYSRKKHLISGSLRDLKEKGIEPQTIGLKNIAQFVLRPPKVREKLDRILMYLYRHSDTLFAPVTLPKSEPAIASAKNDDEFAMMLTPLQELGEIQIVEGGYRWKYNLTLEGVKRAEILSETSSVSKQCFVAMWFEPCEMNGVYSNAISVAVKKAGYDPLIISEKEQNNDICDEIIAEIRSSKFLVADLTGNRGGVYYEAGFAQGLGIPVIWCCRKDWFDTQIDVKKDGTDEEGKPRTVTVKETRRVHFDVNHLGFIVWENQEKLQKNCTTGSRPR